jgi:hypothetical protein
MSILLSLRILTGENGEKYQGIIYRPETHAGRGFPAIEIRNWLKRQMKRLLASQGKRFADTILRTGKVEEDKYVY